MNIATRMGGLVAVTCGVALGASAVCAAPTLAGGTAGPPRWAIASVAEPTSFAPGVAAGYQIVVTNVGGETTIGKIKIEDTTPAGATITAVYDEKAGAVKMNAGAAFGQTSEEAIPLDCPKAPYSSSVTCEYEHPVPPGDSLALAIVVEVTAKQGETLAPNVVTVVGGGASEATSAAPTTPVRSEAESLATPFGVAQLGAATSTAAAGEHPNFTTSFSLNTASRGFPPSLPHEIQVTLPAGVIGNPQATPRCNVGAIEVFECPPDTAVGVATIRLEDGPIYDTLIYNIVPYQDEPAAFDFQLAKGLAKVRLDTDVVPDASAPGRYAVRVLIPQINESEPLVSSSVTMWGDPSQFDGPGEFYAAGGIGKPITFGSKGELAGPLAKAFMRNPTSCAGPQELGLQVDSWQQPGLFSSATASLPSSEGEGVSASFTGCQALNALFRPTIEVSPDSTTEVQRGSHTYRPGEPSGYEIGLNVPQSELASMPGTPDVKGVTLTMPIGVVASPAAANGLTACSELQLDPSSSEAANCPQSSQIGTLEITSPLLEEALHGQVFLGKPECPLCGKAEAAEGQMVRLFLQAAYGKGAAEGRYVRIKLMGKTSIDQSTGQLTSTFENNPQLPFSKLTLHLDGGPNAVLANPSTCGTATATAKLTPWSGSVAEPASAQSSSSFLIEGCSPPAFNPSFVAGTAGNGHGSSYSPFSLTFGRSDSEQTLSAIAVKLPPGLAGIVAHVTQCGEEQANEGTCPASSEVGTVSAAVGPGPDPYWISHGKAFLTGPYHGDPFGLSIVVPAIAGPFTLAGLTGTGAPGHGAVVVRAAIAVNPVTAAITVTSNPMPQELDGIPLQVRTVNVDVNRPEFTFNATNCEAMSVNADITSGQGGSAAVSSPYQATSCAALPFKPGFKVYTHAHHTRQKGAYLRVVVTSSQGQANIGKVHVALPIALPSRLATLKQACGEAQFAANPAGCPEGSFVGTAVASTPVLTKALTGPAIFVSHGGRGFPDLDIVLQGEGITIDLTGNTFISKGVTTSTFKSVPDVPVSRFVLTLPEGPHSALSGTGNFCIQSRSQKKRIELKRHGYAVRRKGHVVYRTKTVKHAVARKLMMPTVITGQNGAISERKTKITVEGCKAKRGVSKATAKRR